LLRAGIRMGLQIGQKVLVTGSEGDGFAEVMSYPDASDAVEVAYFLNPVQMVTRRVSQRTLKRPELPGQTRCYYSDNGTVLVGRVLSCVRSINGASYHVSFPLNNVRLMAETDFHVRSYLPAGDPVATLTSLAHQTPFLFDRRAEWFERYIRQVWFSRGLRGLISSKIEFFPHQVEIVRRVLQDPIVRYLLADEVGLGKTIEAGVILRQLHLDAPHLRILVLVPRLLVQQWRDELADRFDLTDLEVKSHEEVTASQLGTHGIIVVDEAHRIVTGNLYEAFCRLTHPRKTRHLLLLSATPILHHENELLALLHLLDPDTYKLEQLEEFRARLEKRHELGRTLLALSRSTRAAFILRHVRRCAELLPDDSMVTKIARSSEAAAQEGNDNGVQQQLAASLSVHLTETYRIHRRLLRTRRAMVLEEGDLHQLRAEDALIYEFQGQQAGRVEELWRTLEEWRTRVAAHAAGSAPTKREELIRLYLDFAQATAADRRRLVAMLAARQGVRDVPHEGETIERLLKLARSIGDERRLEVLLRYLQQLDQGHFVIFCTHSSRCSEIADFLADRWRGRSVVLTANSSATDAARTVSEFRASKLAVLIADRSAEEGMNLQFADGGLLLDLPFNPMRLEQRLGRMDRMGRRRPIRCTPILSISDPTLAFDTAWYQVLTKGLGLLQGSLADVQFLLEREVRRLSEIVFEGGPAALLAQVPSLAQSLDREREAVAEQDVLDGLYLGGLRDSSLWQSIESGDEEEREFGDALENYMKDNIGLRVSSDPVPGKGRTLQFRLRMSPPLVPTDLLVGIGDYAGTPATVSRTLATQNLDFEFFRPGHPLVESLYAMAEWDERGQAFALWRQMPGIPEPVFVFRAALRTILEIDTIHDRLDEVGWDEVSRGSLLRLIESWQPQRFYEVFLDADGSPAEPRFMKACMPSYAAGHDINLGGKRAHVLVDLTGPSAWREMCESAARSAHRQVLSDPSFLTATSQARRAAGEYFEMVLARLRERGRLRAEDATAVAKLIAEQDLLRQLVDSVLAKPCIKIDSIGVYVLSERPACPL
jgi:ATP-dependent helicase HepA